MRAPLAWAAILAVIWVPAGNAQGLAASPHAATCFLDVDGDGLRGLDEPVYLQQSCPGGASAGDARLFSWGGHPGGTLVSGLHDDSGLATVAIATTYAYHDADGGGSYNLGDPLFLAFGPVPGPARPGDLPLTGQDAFTSLRGNDSRVGIPLAATAVTVGGESFAERDGNPGFSTGDVIYLDLDGNGQSSLGDLRLAVPVQQTTPTASASSTRTSSEPSAPGSESTTSASSSTPAASAPSPRASPGSKGAPGPGPVAAAMVLAMLVWWRRPYQGI